MKIKQEESFLENYAREVMKNFGQGKWTEDETKLSFKKGTKEIGFLKFEDDHLEVSGTEIIKFVKKLDEKRKSLEEQKITNDYIKKSVFKDIIKNKDSFGGIEHNPILFKKIEKQLKSAGIHTLLINTNISLTSSICDSPTIFFGCPVDSTAIKNTPSGYAERLKTLLFNEYPDIYKKKENVSLPPTYFISNMVGEKSKEFKVGNITAGQYFPERNLINMHYNPFDIQTILPLSGEINKPVSDFLKAIKELGVKSNNVVSIREKMFITAFMKNTKKRLSSVESEISSVEKNVTDYEIEIKKLFDILNEKNLEKEFLENNIKTGGKGIFDEIEKAKKLSFLKNINIKGDKISMEFQEATISVPTFKRGDSGKSFGKRTMYLGNIKFEISPSSFNVFSDNNVTAGHPHPHGSGSGACFGDGSGRNKIYEMLSANKFSEVAKLLWFWIHTYKNGGAYVKMWNAYDDRLSKGYPVWDEKGKRIKLNDPDRIKSGEQKNLSKSGDYDKNIKKFKDYKVF